MNPQVQCLGAGTNVPMTTDGTPGAIASVGSYTLVNPDGTLYNQANNSYVVANSGLTVTIAGIVYPVLTLTLTAIFGAQGGVGATLVQCQNAGHYAYARFDVVNAGGGGGTAPILTAPILSATPQIAGPDILLQCTVPTS